MPSKPNSIRDALSFDLEDWFHMLDVPSLSDPKEWLTLPTLLERTIVPVLGRLRSRQVRATFFVLGWIAAQYPELICKIAADGHEIASHAHWHRRLDQLTPESLTEELNLASSAIFQACGVHPRGFRAPSFSITPGSEWILDALVQAGFSYDASLFPARRDNGGYACPRGPHFQCTPTGVSLPEFPMSIMNLGPFPLAFSGGGYLRLLPLPLIHMGFRQAHRQGNPVVVYLHPRDFAPDAPRVAMSLAKRFKSRVGLSTTWAKFETLLDTYNFTTCAEVLSERGLLKGP